MIENQTLEISGYRSQLKEVEETISGLHNTIVNLKSIPNNKLSVEDINKLQLKMLELQTANTDLNKEIEHLIKAETVSERASETNDNNIVELERLLSEKTNEGEYFQESCDNFEGKMQGNCKILTNEALLFWVRTDINWASLSVIRRQAYRRCASEQ